MDEEATRVSTEGATYSDVIRSPEPISGSYSTVHGEQSPRLDAAVHQFTS